MYTLEPSSSSSSSTFAAAAAPALTPVQVHQYVQDELVAASHAAAMATSMSMSRPPEVPAAEAIAQDTAMERLRQRQAKMAMGKGGRAPPPAAPPARDGAGHSSHGPADTSGGGGGGGSGSSSRSNSVGRSVAPPHADPAAPVQQQPQPMHAPSPALVAAAAAAAAGSPQMRGAGRGMANVLPAWMTAQQQQQQAGFAPPVAGQFDNAWGGNGAAGAGGAHASPTQNGAPPRSDLRYS